MFHVTHFFRKHAAIPFIVMAPAWVFAAVTTPQIPDTGVTDISYVFYYFCQAVNWFFGFILVLAVVFILYAAYNFFGAGGDEQQVKKSRDLVKYALYGVTIAILAKALVIVIGDFLGVKLIAMKFFGGCWKPLD